MIAHHPSPLRCPSCNAAGRVIGGPDTVARMFVPAIRRRHECKCGARWTTYQIAAGAMRACGRLVRSARAIAGRLHEIDGAG
jgi:uncharacterized Zn-binding protein involved in type VI secretion